ncbi:MAG: hypothetical protein KGY46_11710 [Anaerolineales bacterium]|nr:hypothetical protein [Anaerolineales bacterium]
MTKKTVRKMFVNVLHGPDLVFILGDISLAFIADVGGLGLHVLGDLNLVKGIGGAIGTA